LKENIKKYTLMIPAMMKKLDALVKPVKPKRIKQVKPKADVEMTPAYKNCASCTYQNAYTAKSCEICNLAFPEAEVKDVKEVLKIEN